MQSIFRLPWCSDPTAPKSEHVAMDRMRASPMVEIPMLNKLKRKRTDSADFTSARTHDFKKLRPDSLESPLPVLSISQPPTTSKNMQPAVYAQETVNTPAPLPEPLNVERSESPASFLAPEPPAASTDLHQPTKTMDSPLQTSAFESSAFAAPDVKGLTPLQQVIESEFNMQILMKHNELRLIEQELAKCQIALEQLRRCEVRPYPGNDRLSANVSSGTGAAVLPPAGHSRPSHPAPHGVTDGPYSRHYKQWLLRDPQFDSFPLGMLSPEASGRPTRNSGSTRKSFNSSFTFPGRQAEKMPSLPNYPAAPPKDKNQPNVLRRSDGKFVKLICNDCQRGSFSSIQGFLNHCRIAHKVDYKSHDQAAWSCGRPLDDEELANLPSETQQAPIPKPAVSRTPTTVAPPPQRSNLVHPFNASSGAPVLSTPQGKKAAPKQAIRMLNSVAPAPVSAPLTPTPQLPRLSAHFAKYNHGGDLAKAASEAKQRIDLFVYDDDFTSPDISEQNSPVAPSGSHLSSLGLNNREDTRPASSKGSRQPQQSAKPRPSPLAPMPSDIPSSPHSHHSAQTPSSLNDLSPHTADSNPGLVSDHEGDEDDDEHGSASESDDGPVPHATRALPGSRHGTTCSRDIDMEMELDVAEGEIDRRTGVVIRRNSVQGDDAGRAFGAGGVGKGSV